MKTIKISKNSFIQSSENRTNRKLISSIGEFLSYVEIITKTWGLGNLWFRGVTDSNYKLVPAIYRESVWKYDPQDSLNIANYFIHKAKGLLNNFSNLGKWEWYQTMQHYGLPTRLLDWTEGALIGLFFACKNDGIKTNPCVWIINPYDLNRIVTGGEFVYFSDAMTRDDNDNIIVDNYLYDVYDLKEYPIAISPPYVNERMVAQKSCFTVHGKKTDGLEEIFRNNPDFEIIQLRISKSKVGIIKKQLCKMGITEGTLFPDLEGLTIELRYEFGMK